MAKASGAVRMVAPELSCRACDGDGRAWSEKAQRFLRRACERCGGTTYEPPPVEEASRNLRHAAHLYHTAPIGRKEGAQQLLEACAIIFGRARAIAGTAIALLLLSANAHATTLLAVGGDASYHVDSTTGAATVATNPAGGEILIALATDPKAGTVYGIDLGAWPTGAMQLMAFDAGGAVASTAAISYLGQPVLLAEGLAFAPSGKLWVGFGYGADFDYYQSGHLGIVDPATGTIDPASVLDMAKVSYPNADADALEFVGGTLYMSDNVFGVGSNLYTINLSTGLATLVGQIKDAAGAFQVTDLAWDGSTLWAETIGGQLLTVNRATAAATKVGAAAGLELDGLTATAACHGRGCR